jgi:hypothetical protein
VFTCCKNRKHYIRIATFKLDEILPLVFTQKVRHTLKLEGHGYNSELWKLNSKREFSILINNKLEKITVPMGSHRYQLFAEKGTKCVECGIEGEYFALESCKKGNQDKFHFNLYGIDKRGKEIMLTKDHIIARSNGGDNKLSNYQPMCISCNKKKADK